MPAYTNLANALVAVGAKPFATTIQSLRDNPIAIAEGDPTAPVVASAWHPFNKVTNGDANTGEIWSFPTNGAVAAVTSPDFVDGYEYAFLFDQVRGSAASTLRGNYFRETDNAYAGVQILNADDFSAGLNGWFEIRRPRSILRHHYAEGRLAAVGANAVGSGFSSQPVGAINSVPLDILYYPFHVRHTTAQKILRVQFTASTGNITGSGSTGRIFMFRRRVV